uniref:Tf2-1-like SH3-like domain-containing protein n=1 Tax=Chenopodium quinoa TaxID=63459 RepID=A0A803N892_CHEQI
LLDHVSKLRGCPRSIVSNKDSVFLSQFWKGLFSLHGVELLLSSTYHPEIVGEIESYRQQSVQFRSNNKLAAKFYGPFKVIAQIGKVAYRVQLPTHAKIHDVFHVFQLKAFTGPLSTVAMVLEWTEAPTSLPHLLAAIFDTRVV